MSLLGAVFCLAAGFSLALGGPILIAAILFPVGGLCDLADGAIARAAHSEQSKTGAFLDSICDKVGEAAMFVGIVVGIDDVSVTYLAATAFASGTLASYTKAVAGEHRLGIAWPEVRIFGRAGRIVLLSATLMIEAVRDTQDHRGFVVGLGMLLVFNCASFGWRLKRVAAHL